MDILDKRVTTRKAAEIIGWGYEGLRTNLKRGLLKHTGLLLPMVARGTPAPELDAKRWTWTEFGLADLCAFRLAKLLMDAGQSFDQANQIASDDGLWQFFAWPDNYAPENQPAFLVVSAKPYGAWALYTPDQFHQSFLSDIEGADVGHILIDLRTLRGKILAALSEA